MSRLTDTSTSKNSPTFWEIHISNFSFHAESEKSYLFVKTPAKFALLSIKTGNRGKQQIFLSENPQSFL